MLKPIPTPHPVIMAVSLAILTAIIVYSLRVGIETPYSPLLIYVSIAVAGVCTWSRNRRAKEIDRRYSTSRPHRY